MRSPSARLIALLGVPVLLAGLVAAMRDPTVQDDCLLAALRHSPGDYEPFPDPRALFDQAEVVVVGRASGARPNRVLQGGLERWAIEIDVTGLFKGPPNLIGQIADVEIVPLQVDVTTVTQCVRNHELLIFADDYSTAPVERLLPGTPASRRVLVPYPQGLIARTPSGFVGVIIDLTGSGPGWDRLETFEALTASLAGQ